MEAGAFAVDIVDRETRSLLPVRVAAFGGTSGRVAGATPTGPRGSVTYADRALLVAYELTIHHDYVDADRRVPARLRRSPTTVTG